MNQVKLEAKDNTNTAIGSIKKRKIKSPYPTIPIMVNTAIKELKEHNGSTVHAIRKYLSENYKATSDIVYRYIKKYLRSAVNEGKLIQTRGRGAYGSFKLPSAKKLKAINKVSVENKPIKSHKKATDASKMKNQAKISSAVVKKVAIVNDKTPAIKKPTVKKRLVIKIALKTKPTKVKNGAMKNIKTPKSRSASQT